MKLLTEQDYKEAAEKLGTEIAIIKAVAEVESAGSGFLYNGAPKILFEGHQFHRRVSVECKDITICAPNWNEARKYYQGRLREYSRLALAMSYDAEAALMSTSWGKFQIMGFNHFKCLYEDVFKFVQDMYVSEKVHLDAFLCFIKKAGLIEHMKNKDWNKFAAGYNGRRYKENHYDTK